MIGLLVVGAAIVGAVVAVTKVSAKTYPKGDINGDGVVDDQDLQIIYRMILGLTSDADGNPYPADWYKRADVNGDGEIDMGDVVAIDNIILKG